MFVVASTTERRIREVQAYLYNGQEIVSEPVETEFGGRAVVVESAFGLPGNMLADRLASGMIGARAFETREEADAYLRDELGAKL